MTTDRRSLSDVVSIVKKSNNKLSELKSELHELESQILLTKGNSVGNGQGKYAARPVEGEINAFLSGQILISHLTLPI